MRTMNGLEYEVQGEGEPVLLVHGSILADAYLPFLKESALANYRLILYHRRGFSGSQRHIGPFSIEEQAQDALSLLRHLGVGSAHVFGHSTGGSIALQLAIDAPDAVHSLVLEEPTLFMVPSAGAVFAAMAPVVEKYASGDPVGAIHSFMDGVLGPGWPQYVERNIPGGIAQAEADAATLFEVELPSLQNWQFDETRAVKISQPLLYVLGGKSEAIAQEGKDLIREWIPQSEEVLVEGLGHALHIEDPGAVIPGISAFLARHPIQP